MDFGLSIPKMLETPVKEIAQMIHSVGFYQQASKC